MKSLWILLVASEDFYQKFICFEAETDENDHDSELHDVSDDYDWQVWSGFAPCDSCKFTWSSDREVTEFTWSEMC